MKCPNCGSEHLQKKGSRGGKQRYRCTVCFSSFTEGVPYKPAVKLPPLDIECPRCKSHKVNRDGKDNGGQRFRCMECGLGFSEKTNYEALEPIKWTCPYCGGSLNYSGYGKKGQRHFYCKSCNRSCSADLETGEPIKKVTFKDINKDIHCPVCNSLALKKGGTSKGRPKFTCCDCGKHFVLNPEKDVKDITTKKIIINKVLKGADLHKVAEEYKYNYDHLRKIMRPYYSAERITNEQANLIVKFGVHLNVPMDYLAEYVKCSRRMCKNIMDKYKKRIKSANL